jgi:hypothetical protein
MTPRVWLLRWWSAGRRAAVVLVDLGRCGLDDFLGALHEGLEGENGDGEGGGDGDSAGADPPMTVELATLEAHRTALAAPPRDAMRTLLERIVVLRSTARWLMGGVGCRAGR